MKLTKYLTVFVLAMATAAFAAPPAPQNTFSVGSTNKNGTLSYAIISANSANGGAPRITYINAGSDIATGSIQYYRVLDQSGVIYTNSTTTLYVSDTNGFSGATSDIIIIRHVLTDTYEKRTLANSNSSSTNLVVTAAPYTTVPGDIIYKVSTTAPELARAGTLLWGVATNGLSATGGIYQGQRDFSQSLPLLLEINASTAGTINVVSGDYVK